MNITNDIADAPDTASQHLHPALKRYITFANIEDFAADNKTDRVIVEFRPDGAVVLSVLGVVRS